MTTEKCAVCPAEATADVWFTPVCPDCFRKWMAESPMPAEVEAKARPDQFETTYHGMYMSIRQLKPGLLERFYKGWTAAWVQRQRKEAA